MGVVNSKMGVTAIFSRAFRAHSVLCLPTQKFLRAPLTVPQPTCKPLFFLMPKHWALPLRASCDFYPNFVHPESLPGGPAGLVPKLKARL